MLDMKYPKMIADKALNSLGGRVMINKKITFLVILFCKKRRRVA